MSWAIRVEDLGKKYRRGEVQPLNLNFREALTDFTKNCLSRLNPFGAGSSRAGATPVSDLEEDSEFWALRDINMEIHEGEVVGVVGRNGAGKSTLLKIMSRITWPTCGVVRYRGKMASLLEVGTGFHRELTGRENIFLNGEILGMRRAEVARKCDEIVAFAEVEKFLDTPVKFYSSGMYLRLAFAVAAHLEPEILIVDEVLAVGDWAFQKKCLGRMSEVARSGRTILFVSHNMGAIVELCNRAILLHHGKQLAQGQVTDVLEAYSRLISQGGCQTQLSVNPSLPCSVAAVKLYDDTGRETSSFDIAQSLVFSITYQVTTSLQGLQITLTLARNMVDVVHSFDTDGMDKLPLRQPGTYEARHTIPKMFFKAGVYSARITAGTPDRLIQDLESVLHFEIEELSQNTHMKGYRKERAGHVISPGTWETRKLK